MPVPYACDLESCVWDVVSPEPAVSWRKDGRHISTSSHRYRYGNFHTELIIEDVQPSDEAAYTCHGTNDVGTSRQSIFLDVQGITITSALLHNQWRI